MKTKNWFVKSLYTKNRTGESAEISFSQTGNQTWQTKRKSRDRTSIFVFVFEKKDQRWRTVKENWWGPAGSTMLMVWAAVFLTRSWWKLKIIVTEQSASLLHLLLLRSTVAPCLSHKFFFSSRIKGSRIENNRIFFIWLKNPTKRRKKQIRDLSSSSSFSRNWRDGLIVCLHGTTMRHWIVLLCSWESGFTSPSNFVFTQLYQAVSQQEQWHLLSELIAWRALGDDIQHQCSRTGPAAVLGILGRRATMDAIHSFIWRWNRQLTISSPPPLQVSVGCCCGRPIVTHDNTLGPWTEGHQHWNSSTSAAGTLVVVKTSCCCCSCHMQRRDSPAPKNMANNHLQHTLVFTNKRITDNGLQV